MAITKAGIVKRIIVYGSLLAALNQFSSACMTTLYYNTKSPAVAKVEQKEKVPDDFGALEYLLLAKSFAHKDAPDSYACVEYTESTFHAYQKLVKDNNRDDLSDKVRIVFGKVDDGRKKDQHAWLQYINDEGDIEDFETTAFMRKLKIRDIRWLIQMQDVNSFNLKVVRTDMVSDWGSAFKKPTSEFIFYPGGAARILYETYVQK